MLGSAGARAPRGTGPRGIEPPAALWTRRWPTHADPPDAETPETAARFDGTADAPCSGASPCGSGAAGREPPPSTGPERPGLGAQQRFRRWVHREGGCRAARGRCLTSRCARPKRASCPAGCRFPGKPRAPAHRQPASFWPRNAPYLGLPPPAWSAPVPGGWRGPGAAERGWARCGPHGAPGAVGAPRPRGWGARSGSPQHHLLVTGPARGSRHPPAATPAPGGPEVAGPSGARAPRTHSCLLPVSRAPWKKKPRASKEGARSARALRSSEGKDEASPTHPVPRQEAPLGLNGKCTKWDLSWNGPVNAAGLQNSPGEATGHAHGDKKQQRVPRRQAWSSGDSSAIEVRGSGGKGCAISAVQSPGIPGQEEGNLSLEICVRLQTTSVFNST